MARRGLRRRVELLERREGARDRQVNDLIDRVEKLEHKIEARENQIENNKKIENVWKKISRLNRGNDALKSQRNKGKFWN